ncbi:Gfo/Idh/MocA family protein [Enterococcus sp. LJL128]
MTGIKLAVIGYGGMGSYHVETILKNETAIEVVGIYDILTDRKEAAAEKGWYCFSDLEELLADEAVEAVLIATPNDSHKDLAVTALRAGKHVVCEKPVTLNVAELDEILSVAEETGNTFMVHQNRRWDPDFLIIRELYKKQQIGELFQIESRVHGGNGIPGDWRHLKKHGGGMALDWGVHLFDQLLWLIDSPIKACYSDLSYILGDEVDDGFMVHLIFENGVRALIEVGTTNYVNLPRWYVKGTAGTAKIEDWDLSGEVIRATGKEQQTPKPIQAGVGLTKTMAPPSKEATEALTMPEVLETFPSFYQNFYEVVRQGAEPIVKNEEVRYVLELIESILSKGEQSSVDNCREKLLRDIDAAEMKRETSKALV